MGFWHPVSTYCVRLKMIGQVDCSKKSDRFVIFTPQMAHSSFGNFYL
jgi:hypothetical protein